MNDTPSHFESSSDRWATVMYRNPRLLLLAVCLILVAGLSSFHTLPRLEDPTLQQRFALVKTRFPGADAARVETQVTDPIEEKLREVEEIKNVKSTSSAEISIIEVELHDEVRHVDEVWSRIRDKLGDIKPMLPESARGPVFEDVDTRGYAMIVGLVWEQDGPSNFAILGRHAEELEDVLLCLPGTEDVRKFGAPREEITVEIERSQVVALGLDPERISEQIAGSDAKVSAGQLHSAADDLLVEVLSELDSLDRIRQMPIRIGDGGRFVRLGEIATISKGVARPRADEVLLDGHTSVALAVYVLPNHRVDHWSDFAQATLESYAEGLPEGVRLQVIFDQSRYTRSRLDSLLGNLLLGGFAVVCVVLVMMGWKSAVAVGSALPLSALMVFAGMRCLKIPIHQMSVTGLIIALGLLIDNAIVIVDEVRNSLNAGIKPLRAIGGSVRHLAIPLFGSTLTTALAFMPIALMDGPAGEFVYAIASSVILALCSSLLLSLTVIPALMVYLNGSSKPQPVRAWWRDGFSCPGWKTAYRRTLKYVFHRPVIGLVLAATLPFVGFFGATQLSEQFFPPAERDQFQIEFDLPPQTSIEETRAVVQAARELMLADDAVEAVHWFLGENAPSFYYNMLNSRDDAPFFAQALVQLKTAEDAPNVIRRLQTLLDERFPQGRTLARQLQQGPPFESPVELRLYGPDLDRLRALGESVRAVLADTPDVLHTRAELGVVLPKLGLVIDEDAARLAGLDHASIARQFQVSLEGTLGGTLTEGTEDLPIRVRLTDGERGDLEKLLSLDLAAGTTGSPTGANSPPIPVSAVAHVRLLPEAGAILRRNGRRVNNVQAFVTTGVLPATVLASFRRRLAEAQIEFPAGYSFEYGGETEERAKSVGNLMGSVGVLGVLMAATLVLSFGSFRLAALIAVVAVLSVGLGAGALWLFGYPFGFMAIVAIMGLVGVAVNDSIVVLAGIRGDSRATTGDPDAVAEVVVRATRHVLATTVTTVAGFTPLMVDGGGFWPPVATAIAGGVVGSTLLALYFVPSAYVMLNPQAAQPQNLDEILSTVAVDDTFVLVTQPSLATETATNFG